MTLENIVKRAKRLVIPSIAAALISYSAPISDSQNARNSHGPSYSSRAGMSHSRRAELKRQLAPGIITPGMTTTASYYGRGSRRDPKPALHLRRLDDTYGNSVWDYFCAMPNRKGGLIGKKVRVDIPSKRKSVVLVVADDGPDQRVHPNRKIDISHHAAGYLGFRRDGLAKVRISFVPKYEKIGPAEYR